MKRPMVMIFVAALTCVSACKFQSSGADVKAIESEDGKAAFTFLPMRQDYVPADGATVNRDVVEHGLRLAFGPVECKGADALKRVNLLEGFAFSNPEGVRRKGRRILIADDRTSMDLGCELIGDYLVGAASFASILGNNTLAGYQTKQTLWLTIRGWQVAGEIAWPLPVAEFIAENLGESRDGGGAYTLDKALNPCVATTKVARADYACRGNGNFKALKNYKALRDGLLHQVAAIESKFLVALLHADKAQALGYRYQVTPSLVLQDLKNAPLEGGSENDAVIKLIAADLKTKLKVTAGIEVGSRRHSVYSVSNPQDVDNPARNASRHDWQDVPGTKRKSYDGGRSQWEKSATTDLFVRYLFRPGIPTTAARSSLSLADQATRDERADYLRDRLQIPPKPETAQALLNGRVKDNQQINNGVKNLLTEQPWGNPNFPKYGYDARTNNCANNAAAACRVVQEVTGGPTGMVHLTSERPEIERDPTTHAPILLDSTTGERSTFDAWGKKLSDSGVSDDEINRRAEQLKAVPVLDAAGVPKSERIEHAVYYRQLGLGDDGKPKYAFGDVRMRDPADGVSVQDFDNEGSGYGSVGEWLKNSEGDDYNKAWGTTTPWKVADGKEPIRALKTDVASTNFWDNPETKNEANPLKSDGVLRQESAPGSGQFKTVAVPEDLDFVEAYKQQDQNGGGFGGGYGGEQQPMSGPPGGSAGFDAGPPSSSDDVSVTLE